MSVVSGSPRVVYAAAVERLAASVVCALGSADGVFRLRDQLPGSEGMAGLAALRILGPDALAPFVLSGHRFSAEDAEMVAASLRVFPMAAPGAQIASQLEGGVPVRALRDWATGQVLTRLGARGFARPYPRGAGVGRDRGWLRWAVVLAQLSPLASPGVDSPVHAQVRRYPQEVARGVTWAMLRRDYLTAVRLVRWLLAENEPVEDPWFPLEPVMRHVELVAEPNARLLLELAVARRSREGSVS
ncbi:MAG: hypothetical protein JO309_07950 [Pseudonocardiales bacterium]|nr:hypothetical protein [Pseudonocardiales bacterium]